MTRSFQRPCYCCGKPCWNKGCRECLTKGRHAGLNKKKDWWIKKKGDKK